MPRTCSVCKHPRKAEIDAALISDEPYRIIAERFGTSASATYRHRDHLPSSLLAAQEVEEVARADSLLDQIRDYQAHVDRLTRKAEQAGDFRTALSGLREARGYLELLAKLVGELDDRPQINLNISPEWLELRAVIVGALDPHPDALQSVLGALESAENGSAEGRRDG
jgi:hypothetical protein